MKVAHVIGDLVHGGAELLAVRMAKYLLNSGASSSIVVLGSAQEDLVRRVRSESIPIEVLGLSSRSPALPIRLRRVLAKDSPNVVHAHLFPPLYACALARLPGSLGAKWIYTEHSTFNRRRHMSGMRAIERFMYGRYDAVACVSDGARAELGKWLPSLKTVTVENGVELERFRSAAPVDRMDLGATLPGKLVLTVGALRPEKNQIALVDALQFLPPDYGLVIAGEGPERARIEARVLELGFGARVTLLGDYERVPELMAACDVYVLPSFAEAFGLSAVEAAATGLPVVYADVAGLADLFRGVGVPTDPRDPSSIAAAVLRAADPGMRCDLSRNGVALSERYSMQRMMSNYLELYAR